MDIIFLTREDILTIHADMLLHFGGTSGIRDDGMLEAALSMPRIGFDDTYLHEGFSAMAAAYLYHLVMNHPFIDGNKRVGAMAAVVFLDINNIELSADEDEYEALIWRVACGEIEKDQIADFLRRNSKPR